MRPILMLAVLLGVTAPALAATSAPGVNLRWDQCYSDGGAWNKDFACDTNTGTERLVATFELDTDLAQLSGIEMRFDVVAAAPTLPAWWQFKNVGTCRSTSLTLNLGLPVGAVHCTDWTGGQAGGGIGAYQIGTYGPDKAAIVAAIGVPPSSVTDVSAGVEYLASTFLINHAKTVGTGSCGGCQIPACVFFSSAKLTTPTPSIVRQLTRGANYLGSQYVTWQRGYPINIVRDCQLHIVANCTQNVAIYDCVLATPTHSHGSTWGAVKSLYR